MEVSLTLSSTLQLKLNKENNIYARSLEEFIESNIKWVNHLIQYKQNTNYILVKINKECRNNLNTIDYELKRNNQIKSEIVNTINTNNSIRNQNQNMLQGGCYISINLRFSGS